MLTHRENNPTCKQGFYSALSIPTSLVAMASHLGNTTDPQVSFLHSITQRQNIHAHEQEEAHTQTHNIYTHKRTFTHKHAQKHAHYIHTCI